jgi:hypothetical protein
MPRLRQLKAEAPGFSAEKLVRELHKDARPVSRKRIGANRTAMLEVKKDFKAVLDDLVALFTLDIDDQAKPAGIMLLCRLVKALRLRKAVSVNLAVTWMHRRLSHGVNSAKLSGAMNDLGVAGSGAWPPASAQLGVQGRHFRAADAMAA